MFNKLDSRSPIPLYDQIATRLRVNPATVVQAYRELEGEGFVEMRQGAGTFVCEVGTAKRSSERAKQARRLVRNMLGEAARLGLDGDEIAEAVSRELGVKTHE